MSAARALGLVLILGLAACASTGSERRFDGAYGGISGGAAIGGR